jgi:hypothetical protein
MAVLERAVLVPEPHREKGKRGAKGAPGKMSGGGGANERIIDILAESGTYLGK